MLDLGDENWSTIFSRDQLDRLDAFGDPLFPPLPPALANILDELSKLVRVNDVRDAIRTGRLPLAQFLLITVRFNVFVVLLLENSC